MLFFQRLPQHQKVFAAFAIYAFAMGNFFPRLAQIKADLGVEESALGLALIGTPIGTFIALGLAPRLLDRIGHKQTLWIFIPVISMAFAIASFATTPLLLFFLLIPAGLAIGAIEVVINVEADRAEAQMDRRIMSRAHAFWSIGFGAAGLTGAAMAGLGITPQVHLILVVIVTLVLTMLVLTSFTPAEARSAQAEEDAPRIATPTWPIVILVAISLSAMLLEGASIDWSAIYMDEVFAAPAVFGGLAVAASAISQAVVRYYADGFVDRYSPVLVARVLLITMSIGTFLMVIAPNAFVALVGLGLIGAGSSALFPLTISAAAQRTDRPAAVNVAALAQFSFVAFLIGPPLLGFVADHYGLRVAFSVGLPLIFVSLALSHHLGNRPKA